MECFEECSLAVHDAEVSEDRVAVLLFVNVTAPTEDHEEACS